MTKNKKKCLYCSEVVLKDAKKCRYCGEWFTKKRKVPSSIRKHYLLSKNFWIFIIFLFIIFFFNTNVGVNGKYSSDNSGFKKALKRQHELVESGKEDDIREIYQKFLDPKMKTMSEDEYVNGYRDYWKGNYALIQLHSTKMDDNYAYADRTVMECEDKNCNKLISKNRSFKRYYYDNGFWKMEQREVFCPRTTMYEMEPEFIRVLSLIDQRYSEAKASDLELIEINREILNCVDIKYAQSDEEINEAEGVFSFVPGQSSEKLSIYVSPRYKIKDDIITASLLMHELSHATSYILGLLEGVPQDCFLDEAMAFQNQNWFLTILNQEEKQSLIARATMGGSPELRGIMNTLVSVPKYSGQTYVDKALNFVKSNPFYQEQCK